jgi:hypothetical protein
MAHKPRHKEPTNFEHCCSCCIEQEKRIKHLEHTLKQYKDRIKDAYIKTINKRSKTNEVNPI